MAESCTLVEWLADNYTLYGTNLTLVSDRSQEGTQFVKGFGGIGGEFSLCLFLCCWWLIWPIQNDAKS